MKRYAMIKNARSRSEAEAYLPDNYKVIYEYVTTGYDADDNPMRPADSSERERYEVAEHEKLYLGFVIEGEDKSGWTLDDYVIPRYASGLIVAKEIDLSHPIMKHIPEETISEGLVRRRNS